MPSLQKKIRKHVRRTHEGSKMMKVIFKSISPYFDRERDGQKPNTVRRIDMTDDRFLLLAHMKHTGKLGFITIVKICANRNQSFTRKIEDITFFNDWCIISWRHIEKMKK